jgi:DNA-binding transcriptional MerR regulator
MENNDDLVDSIYVSELLGITSNNLRQLVFRKVLVPTGKEKRRSLFKLEDVQRLKAVRTPYVPSE